MHLRDEELLSEIAHNRSEEAFDALTERWREPLRQYLVRKVGSAANAEDIVQEVLLRVWIHATSFDGRGEPRAWAFRIAGNLASNAHRTQSRRREQTPTEDILEGFAADLPLPEEVVLRRESLSQLHHAICHLTEERRELLRCAYDQDQPLARIADTLGIPVGTVKSRLHHTRRALARILEENFPSLEENE